MGNALRTADKFLGEQFSINNSLLRGLAFAGDEANQYGFMEHFYRDVDTTRFEEINTPTTTILDDGATPDPESGVLGIDPGSDTDNDDGYVQTARDIMKPAAGRIFAARARVYVTESTADTANIIFGFHEEFAPDVLADAGAGLTSGSDAAVLIHKDGGTNWELVGQNVTATTVDTDKAFTEDTWVELGIRVECGVSEAVVFAFVDDMNHAVARTTISMTSLASMKLGLGIKNGEAADTDLFVDYLEFRGKR